MATPQRFESIESDRSVGEVPLAEETSLSTECVPVIAPFERLAFEGLARVAAKNPIVNPAEQMRYIFPKK